MSEDKVHKSKVSENPSWRPPSDTRKLGHSIVNYKCGKDDVKNNHTNLKMNVRRIFPTKIEWFC